VAGIADHLCPWQSCYRFTQLLSGSNREAIHTFEGTETMQTPIVGRAITGIGAFA